MDCQPGHLGQPATSYLPDDPHSEDVWLFGQCAFHVRQRLLTREGMALRLGGRALDLLQVLVECAGEIIGKEALIARVWPNSFVEEINLRVHMAAVRRALGDGLGGQRYIETVPQRGYRFVAQVRRGRTCAVAEPAGTPNNLPVRLTPVIGRDEVIGKLVRQLPARRFMTLLGAGGIGKSTVAFRVAERLLPHYRDGVWFIDFSVVNTEQALADCLAGLLGRGTSGRLCDLFSELAQGRRLLIFDNCDAAHECCRRWSETLLAAGTHLAILATSRQPLDAANESPYRLDPLSVPPSSAPLSIDQGLAFSAVQLFVSRAQACRQGRGLHHSDMQAVGDVCRALDGLPLAIELAAAQLEAFGLRGLHAQLPHCVQWLTQGRRTATTRHQSLKASLDWDHQRLAEREQVVLRRLAAFDRFFTVDSAVDVIGCDGLGGQSVRDSIVQLERRSLLSSKANAEDVRYRLATATRLYALEKLECAGELHAFTLRHARHVSLQRWLAASFRSVQLVE